MYFAARSGNASDSEGDEVTQINKAVLCYIGLIIFFFFFIDGRYESRFARYVFVFLSCWFFFNNRCWRWFVLASYVGPGIVLTNNRAIFLKKQMSSIAGNTAAAKSSHRRCATH